MARPAPRRPTMAASAVAAPVASGQLVAAGRPSYDLHAAGPRSERSNAVDQLKSGRAAEGARPRIACLTTVWFPRSHADVIIAKLLGGYGQPAPRDPARYDATVAVRELTELPMPTDAAGRLRAPRVEVVSLYLDQTPPEDIGCEWAARAGVPIFPTVREALTLGGDTLAVDGILLIGEHGAYPTNERGQREYPRRRLFEEAVAVVRESGRSIPLFNDKHLGYAWADAKWMYDTARALGMPLGAGSSISTMPSRWREPSNALPLDARLAGALAVGYGPTEGYGFHTLEALQCMVERRAGGETGVAAVQAIAGPAVWEAFGDGRLDRELLDAALATLETPPSGDLADLAPKPALFFIEYRDGLRATVAMLDGVCQEWLFAARVAGEQDIQATRFRAHSQEPFGHFAYLLEEIQDLICTGQEPHPVERTLLTTGILDRAMESLWRGGVRLETPELAVRYRAPRASR